MKYFYQVLFAFTILLPYPVVSLEPEQHIRIKSNAPFVKRTGCLDIYSATLLEPLPGYGLRRGSSIQFSNFYSAEYRDCIKSRKHSKALPVELQSNRAYSVVITPAPAMAPAIVPAWVLKKDSLQTLHSY